jgi:hypothetical protein
VSIAFAVQFDHHETGDALFPLARRGFCRALVHLAGIAARFLGCGFGKDAEGLLALNIALQLTAGIGNPRREAVAVDSIQLFEVAVLIISQKEHASVVSREASPAQGHHSPQIGAGRVLGCPTLSAKPEGGAFRLVSSKLAGVPQSAVVEQSVGPRLASWRTPLRQP